MYEIRLSFPQFEANFLFIHLFLHTNLLQTYFPYDINSFSQIVAVVFVLKIERVFAGVVQIQEGYNCGSVNNEKVFVVCWVSYHFS